MRTVDIEEARTHLSRLIEQAAAGEPFVITKAGRPLVKMVPIDTPERGAERRFGFLAGQAAAPDDFDRMGAARIERSAAECGERLCRARGHQRPHTGRSTHFRTFTKTHSTAY